MGFGYHTHQHSLGNRVPRPPTALVAHGHDAAQAAAAQAAVALRSVRSVRSVRSDGHGHETMGTLHPTHRLVHPGTRPLSPALAPQRRRSCRPPHVPLGLSVCAHMRKSARTHARTRGGRGGTGGPPASFPLRILARYACDVGLSEERARAASGGDDPRHRESHIARAHVSAQVRTSLLLLRMWVPAPALSGRGSYTGGARGSRHARATMPRHRGAASGPSPSHPAAPRGAGSEIFPIASQYRPIYTPSLRATLSRRPLAPPARAVHSRRPFALPARAARSRRPLTPPPAFTGTGPSWLVSTSQYRPICTPSLRATLSRAYAARLRRPLAPPARAARSRRPLAPPARLREARRSTGTAPFW